MCRVHSKLVRSNIIHVYILKVYTIEYTIHYLWAHKYNASLKTNQPFWLVTPWFGSPCYITYVYELLIAPPQRDFPSELLKWFHLNNSLRPKETKILQYFTKSSKDKKKCLYQTFVLSSLSHSSSHDHSGLSCDSVEGTVSWLETTTLN